MSAANDRTPVTFDPLILLVIAAYLLGPDILESHALLVAKIANFVFQHFPRNLKSPVFVAVICPRIDLVLRTAGFNRHCTCRVDQQKKGREQYASRYSCVDHMSLPVG